MSQDDELFQDLEDYSALDESPTFDFEEDPFAEEEEPRGGVSRTFKIVGAILLVLVLVIVGVLIALAVTGDDELSPNEMTSTAVIQTNTAVAIALDNTVTAVALAEQATREAIMTFEFNATQTEISFQTQSAQATLEAEQTATAEFLAGQTATSEAATQEALNAAMTATESAARTIRGRLVNEDGTVFGNVGIRLYRDDGDGVFNPAPVAIVPTPAASVTPAAPPAGPEETAEVVEGQVAPPETTPAPGIGDGATGGEAGTGDVPDVRPISYGQTVQGTLTGNAPDPWFFTGSEGDLITITTEAGEPEQMDLFLELLGPDDEFLIDDDDSGGDFNAAIFDYALPADGRYTINVDSVAAPGPYSLTLELSSGEAFEEDAAESESAPAPDDASGYTIPPFARVVPIEALGPLPQEGEGTPTPEPDEFITSVITGPDGSFDFGALEPGIYWLELDYDSLPDDLKALVPDPTVELVYVMVDVPVSGEITFTIGALPTATPGLAPIDLTATAFAEQNITPTEGTPGLVTPTDTVEPEMPQSGLFSSDGDGGLDGSNGLTVLAIAAIGLVAVVFIARKLRASA